jgi:hypothetical protein
MKNEYVHNIVISAAKYYNMLLEMPLKRAKSDAKGENCLIR